MIPAELDIEKGCVGLAMAERGALLDMTDLIGDDFADPRCGAVWDLIRAMDAAGEATTPAAVLPALTRLDVRGVDGPWLHDCIQARPVRALAERYARIVANRGALRRLRMVAKRIEQHAHDGADAQEVSEIARAELDATHRATATVHMVGTTLAGTLDTLNAPTRAIPTPWPDLNRLIKGWRPGALYVVGARPGVGKTIIGLQAAVGMTDHGHVAFSSLEMPEREIHARLIAQTAKVALGRLDGSSAESEPLSDHDWSRINDVSGRLLDMRLAVDDRSAVTVLDVRSHARTLARRGSLAGVVVDYLQLLSTPRGDRRPRHEVVADYSRSLKLLAKELDCPVIALSQLNRQSEGRQDKRPMLSDLRESGSVEQDADVVLLLHTPEPEGPQDFQTPNLDLVVAKNRHGVVGSVELTRRGEYAMAEPREWRGRPPERHLTPVPSRRDLA